MLDEAKGTITYLMNRSFHFEHSAENNYSESDLITTINFAFVVRKLHEPWKYVLEYTLLEYTLLFHLLKFLQFHTLIFFKVRATSSTLVTE